MAKKLVMKNSKVFKKVATPVGRLLWMNLVNPKSATDAMQPNKYTCTVAFDPKDAGQAVAIKGLFDAILEVARTAYDDNTITLADLKDNNCLSVVKDGATMQDYLTGLLITSASTGADRPPKVFGPVMSQGELSKEEISKINQGDYGRMVINVSAYQVPQVKKSGITAYLSLVQFARRGEYLGGSSDGRNLLDDLNIESASEDEKAILDSLPIQDTPSAPAKKETKKEAVKEEVKEEVNEEVKEEPKNESFDDLFNF